MKKIGFVGAGKMASAIIKGLIKSGFAKPENITATQAEIDQLEEKSKALGISVISDNKILAQTSDVIFIAVKPNQALDVLKEISPYITPEKLIVSIAAGVRLAKLEANLPINTRIIRVMPNTPALVGEGMSGMIGGKGVNKEDLDYIYNLLSTIGKCIIVDNEAQMDIVTAISGSGPDSYYKLFVTHYIFTSLRSSSNWSIFLCCSSVRIADNTALQANMIVLAVFVSISPFTAMLATLTKVRLTSVGVPILSRIAIFNPFLSIAHCNKYAVVVFVKIPLYKAIGQITMSTCHTGAP